MTVYIVYKYADNTFEGVYTDLIKANQICDYMNTELFDRYGITPIELTTDSFMESVLIKNDIRIINDYLHYYGIN